MDKKMYVKTMVFVSTKMYAIVEAHYSSHSEIRIDTLGQRHRLLCNIFTLSAARGGHNCVLLSSNSSLTAQKQASQGR